MNEMDTLRSELIAQKRKVEFFKTMLKGSRGRTRQDSQDRLELAQGRLAELYFQQRKLLRPN